MAGAEGVFPPTAAAAAARAAVDFAGGSVNAAALNLLVPLGSSGETPLQLLLAPAPRVGGVAGVSADTAARLLAECGGSVGAAHARFAEALAAVAEATAAGGGGGGGGGTPSPTSPKLLRPALPAVCPVCIEEAPAARCAVVAACGHTFCEGCLRSSAAAAAGDPGNAAGLVRCPFGEAACPSGVLSQRELTALLGAAAFAKLDRRQLELATRVDPTMFLCATPDCTFIAAWESEADGPPRLHCPLCEKSRCLLCGASPYHEGAPCAPAGGGGGAPADPAAERRAAEEAATAQFLASAAAGVKPCPGCRTPISQTFGCYKMKCLACGFRFCYACGTVEAACHCTPAGQCVLCPHPLFSFSRRARHTFRPAACQNQPPSHPLFHYRSGFWDNKAGRADFANLQRPPTVGAAVAQPAPPPPPWHSPWGLVSFGGAGGGGAPPPTVGGPAVLLVPDFSLPPEEWEGVPGARLSFPASPFDAGAICAIRGRFFAGTKHPTLWAPLRALR